MRDDELSSPDQPFDKFGAELVEGPDSTASRLFCAHPVSASAAPFMLVSTVTAITSGGVAPVAGCGLARGVARGPHHRRAPGRVHVDHPHAERGGGRNGLRNGVGNIVELEIEEHAIAVLDERAHDGGPSDVNNRLPILNPPATPRNESASASASAALSTSSAIRS